MSALIVLSVLLAGSLMLTSCGPRPQRLFNGKDLSGWTKVGGGATYKVDAGCIVGTHGPGPNTFLRTEDTFEDFDLELDFKWDKPGNSGIQFRSHQRSEDGVVEGYQCELDPTERSWTCGLYYEGPRGWLVPLENSPESQAARRLEEWNHIRIKADGPHLQTWLNGVPCVDFIDSEGERSGFIALQVHSGGTGQMRWRNIQLTRLRN
ncbi:MAG: DUF1080 domain-containing protein [Phycisphaerales bacterium]|nr:DUF1080 domain-containing protein [Phycisphaerales bacterium]